MAPPSKPLKTQVLEAAVARLLAINPSTDSNYHAKFDVVKVQEPPSVQYLRHSGNEVPSSVNRAGFVWHSENTHAVRDSGRNQATLQMVVTAMQRYPWDDRNPFVDQPAGFKPRQEVLGEMESDLERAFEDVRLGGVSVFARPIESRIPSVATTYNAEWPWLELDFLFEVVFKYVRSQPWTTA